MSGILLPGQEKKPKPEGSGIELPQGFSRRRDKEEQPAAPKPVESIPAPTAPPPPSAEAAPVEEQAAPGQPKVDLLFPPTGAQIRCPNCGTTYTVPVFS